MLPTKTTSSLLDQFRKQSPATKLVKAPVAKPPKAVDPIAPSKPKFSNPSVSSGTLKQANPVIAAGLIGMGAAAPWAGTILGRGIGAEVMDRGVPAILDPLSSGNGVLGRAARGLNNVLDKQFSDPEDWIVYKLFPNSAAPPPLRPLRQLIGDSGGGAVGGAAGAAGTVMLANEFDNQ